MVEVGKGIVYAKPVIFGWHKHGIQSHKYPYDVLDHMRPELVDKYWKAVHAALESSG